VMYLARQRASEGRRLRACFRNEMFLACKPLKIRRWIITSESFCSQMREGQEIDHRDCVRCKRNARAGWFLKLGRESLLDVIIWLLWTVCCAKQNDVCCPVRSPFELFIQGLPRWHRIFKAELGSIGREFASSHNHG
jgi:hypothetical protein